MYSIEMITNESAQQLIATGGPANWRTVPGTRGAFADRDTALQAIAALRELGGEYADASFRVVSTRQRAPQPAL